MMRKRKTHHEVSPGTLEERKPSDSLVSVLPLILKFKGADQIKARLLGLLQVLEQLPILRLEINEALRSELEDKLNATKYKSRNVPDIRLKNAKELADKFGGAYQAAYEDLYKEREAEEKIYREKNRNAYLQHIANFNEYCSSLNLLIRSLLGKDSSKEDLTLAWETLSLEINAKLELLSNRDQFFPFQHHLWGLPIRAEKQGLDPLQEVLDFSAIHLSKLQSILNTPVINPEDFLEQNKSYLLDLEQKSKETKENASIRKKPLTVQDIENVVEPSRRDRFNLTAMLLEFAKKEKRNPQEKAAEEFKHSQAFLVTSQQQIQRGLDLDHSSNLLAKVISLLEETSSLQARALYVKAAQALLENAKNWKLDQRDDLVRLEAAQVVFKKIKESDLKTVSQTEALILEVEERIAQARFSQSPAQPRTSTQVEISNLSSDNFHKYMDKPQKFKKWFKEEYGLDLVEKLDPSELSVLQETLTYLKDQQKKLTLSSTSVSDEPKPESKFSKGPS